ncbi:transcription factor domain-containing protein [Mycena galopus ATCC 62051]|nr:transcription factor domain-containing protein [Mycena galopus ATCC 62051]
MALKWQNATHGRCRLNFPREPLMGELIDAYFTHQNIYTPLLHRPTFERAVAQGFHLRNDGFAATLLLACAIVSWWSTDPSLPADLTCGREWFDQVPLTANHMLGPATLYDLQYYRLAIIFLDGSAGSPKASWMLIGMGLSLAQDIGLHVRKTDSQIPSVERELYKRAFWVLVHFDRGMSSETGRPLVCLVEDSMPTVSLCIDTDLLLEVDDEYWEHPVNLFQQPLGVPSRITFFNTLMRLNHILAFCLRGLYSSTKVFPSNRTWAEHAVPELDSVLDT